MEKPMVLATQTGTRIQFESTDSWSPDDEMVVALTASDDIVFSIAEEQALDSYNHMINCTARLNRESAEKLLTWLQAALTKAPYHE